MDEWEKEKKIRVRNLVFSVNALPIKDCFLLIGIRFWGFQSSTRAVYWRCAVLVVSSRPAFRGQTGREGGASAGVYRYYL